MSIVSTLYLFFRLRTCYNVTHVIVNVKLSGSKNSRPRLKRDEIEGTKREQSEGDEVVTCLISFW